MDVLPCEDLLPGDEVRWGERDNTLVVQTRPGDLFTGTAFEVLEIVCFLIGFHHSPPLDDLTPLSPAPRVVGLACLILLTLLVPPVPITIGESFASAGRGC